MKNLLTIIFFIAALVLFVQIIQARTVEEIISKYNRTRGTVNQFQNIFSVRMEGTREMLGQSFPVVVTKVQDKLFRIDFEISGSEGYTIITDHSGWSFIPVKSIEAEPMQSETIENLHEELDIAGPTIDHEFKNIKLSLEGKEEVNGLAAFKIRINYPSGKTLIYLIDKQTNLLVQIRQSSTNIVGNNAVEMITNFADYRSVQGVMFPFKVSNSANGPMAGVTTFNNIKVNVDVPEAMYRP